MNLYSNEKLVNMRILFGTADSIGHSTRWLCQKRYLRQICSTSHDLVKGGLKVRRDGFFNENYMQAKHLKQTTRTPGNVEVVLYLVDDNPSRCTFDASELFDAEHVPPLLQRSINPLTGRPAN
ncbi:hypothetical protein TNCV_2235211 [Trichonephila clavipes]|nr:hypothetical protein TNCV_2235211 [Trichonephila clavipes]